MVIEMGRTFDSLRRTASADQRAAACIVDERRLQALRTLIRKVQQRNRNGLADDASGHQSLMQLVMLTAPMSLALLPVRLTERLLDCRLFTLDADFEH